MVDAPTSAQFNARLTVVEAAIRDLQTRVAALTAGSTTPGAPAVSSVQASTVTTTSATLSGVVEPAAQPFSWQFEYGTTTSYGSVAPATAGTGGATSQPVSTQLGGLTAGVTYHFRLRATNAAGTTRSGDATFATNASPATPTFTLSSTIVDTATGTGSGQVQYTGASWTQCSGGGCISTPDGSYYYGFTAGDTYTLRFTGARVVIFAPDDTSGAAAATVTVDGQPAGAISFAAAGVPANAQRWDSGALGTTNVAHTVVVTVPGSGNNVTLLDRAEVYTITAGGTTVTAPTVTTNAATSIGGNAATVSGAITPNGATTSYRFEYGTTTGYGSLAPTPDASMGNGAATAVSQPLSGLAVNTTYHYRLHAANSAGATNSTDRTFVTSTTATAAGRITRVGNKLMLNGKQYKFAGMNWDYGVGCGLAGSQPNAAQANQYFAELNPRSVTRLWVLPGMDLNQYDLVFAAAKANNQYLLVTLLNGLGDCTSFSASYGTPIASNISSWIQQVVSRHVGQTTIMGYEAANESNEGDGNIANWYQAMAQAIKAIDPQVLFGTGGGNNSNNVGAITSWGSGSAIDMISYHDYYSPAGTLGPRSSIFNQAAQNAGKVWYMGERGFCCGGGDTGNLTTNGQRLSAEYGLYLAGTGDVSNCAGYLYWDFKLTQPENVTAAFGNGLWNAAKTYNNSAWNGS